MASIRTFVKGLLARPRPATSPAASPAAGAAEPTHKVRGWVRIEADNVMRGWALDEFDPGQRLSVRLFIDDKAVGEVTADRPVDKLAEEGRGDGRYGFALVVPQAYRDGREHAFKAVVMAHAHRLKANVLTFVIEQAASPPRLHLIEVTPTGLRARLRGGQYAKDTPLELWSGGARIDPALLISGRTGEGPQAELTLAYPRELFAALERDAMVALPGMVEAGSGAAPVISSTRLRAEARDGGVAVWLDGPLWLGAETSEVSVTDAADGRLLARDEVVVGPDPVLIALPEGVSPDGARVQLTACLIPGLEAVVGDPVPEDAAAPNLIRNAALTDWPAGVLVRGGPAPFEVARGWRVRNNKSPASLRAMAFPLDDEGEACSLTLAAPRVDDWCRLEAEVESRASLAGRRLALSFEAAVAHGPLAAFESPEDFVQIERVFLAPLGGQSGQGVTIARRILVTRETRRLAFTFDAPPDLAGSAFIVAFDFKRPFAITLQRPVLAFAEAGEEAPAALAFEDHAIEAQAKLLVGFESWLSSGVVAPPTVPAAADDRPAPRWAFAPSAERIEVVICMHDAAAETLDCLRSLVGGSALPHLVRIVDDASGEGTRRRIAAFIADKPWMRLDPNPAHLGYTASANRGVRASQADWVILLNSDTVVSQGWIEGLLEAARSAPGIGLVGPLSNAASYQSVPDILDDGGKLKVNELPPGWSVERMAALVAARSERAFPELPLLNGFCTLIRREAFMALGGFDEAAFPVGYGEENDLCLRAGAAGWKLVVADQVYVHHVKSASFGTERRSALQAEGTAALRRLHPEADLAALTALMRDNPALARMRAAVGDALRGEA